MFATSTLAQHYNQDQNSEHTMQHYDLHYPLYKLQIQAYEMCNDFSKKCW